MTSGLLSLRLTAPTLALTIILGALHFMQMCGTNLMLMG